ncbi:MAG: response regulator [Litoreibacter sp.]
MAYSTHGKTWTGTGIFAFAGLFCVGIIAFLTIDVVKDLHSLDSARSDNVQWTLSQTEVEFLEFEVRVSQAVTNPNPDLRIVRRAFDIFYSRVSTLRSGVAYSNLQSNTIYSAALTDIRSFLDSSIVLIDGRDADLISALPQLLLSLDTLHDDVRRLSNTGLILSAINADDQRQNISATLLRLAALAAALIFTLIGFAFYLHRLSTQSQMRALKTLETSARMNTIIATSLDGVVVTDSQGIILEFNQAAEDMFGHSASEVRGQNIASVIIPDHHINAHTAGIRRLEEGGKKRLVGKGRVQIEAKRAGGGLFPIELAIQSAETASGNIYIAFLRDISFQLKAETDLIEARDQALAGEKAKSDFLTAMSHEIRTPLNGLLGNIELLYDTKASPKQLELLGNMQSSGKLLLNHVSDVLDISRYDAGKLTPSPTSLKLDTFIQDLVDNQTSRAATRGTTLSWEWIGTPLDRVMADSDILQNILLNLIGNAVKFTHDGKINIEIEVLNSKGNTCLVEFRIIDTGIGIESDVMERVFEDFETGSASYDRTVGSTGLGLGIAKRFATALGGEIGGESEFGSGSMFWVRLPMRTISTALPEIAAPSGMQPITAPKTVLVVEDNEINRQVVREMLKSDGHTVVEAHDGASGVKIASDTRFDLILMDISMPVMDGRAATRAIRAGNGACTDVPIIALTANIMEGERLAFLADGMNDILSKPLSRRGLRALLVDLPVPHAGIQTDLIDRDKANETLEALGPEVFKIQVGKLDKELKAFITSAQSDDQPNPIALANHAHKCAGAIALFGVGTMFEALKAIEVSLRSDKSINFASEIASISDIWHETHSALLDVASSAREAKL